MHFISSLKTQYKAVVFWLQSVGCGAQLLRWRIAYSNVFVTIHFSRFWSCHSVCSGPKAAIFCFLVVASVFSVEPQRLAMCLSSWVLCGFSQTAEEQQPSKTQMLMLLSTCWHAKASTTKGSAQSIPLTFFCLWKQCLVSERVSRIVFLRVWYYCCITNY